MNVEKDLRRIAGLIADIQYAEPPESLAQMVLANIKPKKTNFFGRVWRRLRTPVSVSPLRALPAGVSALVIFALALTLLWRAPGERVVTKGIHEAADQGFNTVMLFLDRPDAANVELIGSFNNWSKEGIKMVWDKDHRLWVAVLNLKRGSYEYAFRVNNKEIVADPRAMLHRDDGFGHQNSILIVGNGNGNETKI